MSEPRLHHLVHELTVPAPAGVVYGLIADTTQWPLFMPSVIHVEQLEFDGTRERLRMYATANGAVSTWASTRVLDPERRVVSFRHEAPAAPLTAMGGRWTVTPLKADRTVVRIEHDFAVRGEDAGESRWVERATEDNSRADLARFGALAARWTGLDEAVLTFEDSVRIHGSADLAYDTLHRAADWAEELPEWAGLTVTEQQPGVQRLTLPDAEAGRSQLRICFPHAERIVFKDVDPGPLVESHIGEWSVEPDEGVVTLTVAHRVVLSEQATSSAEARRTVRETLGARGAALLGLAKHQAETKVPVLWPR